MSTVTNRANLSIFVAGFLFGLGLVVSGMSNPAKVVGFLDVAGNWDPSLILVMGGGLLVTVPAFHLVLKNSQPLFEEKFFLPTLKAVDSKLVAGAVLFGIGWGIAGFCPGPALAALVSLNPLVLLFLAAMIGGMLLHHFLLE
ncbi:MAG: YeeE/YedE family protein [Pseudomonadales bacterium]|nr:YeeE/YedE family protein [Pseudomonadales bacterium]